MYLKIIDDGVKIFHKFDFFEAAQADLNGTFENLSAISHIEWWTDFQFSREHPKVCVNLQTDVS